MPEIPTTVSRSSILTGGISVPQVPGAYGDFDGLRALARSIGDLGQGLVLNSKTRRQIEERDKQKKDDLWTNQALSEFGRNMTDFEVNPENAGRADYLPGFLENADNNMNAFAGKAPSPEAEAKFRERATGMVDQRYPRSAARGAENEMKADMMQIDDSWSSTLHSYHNLASQDPVAAQDDLLHGLSITTENINSLYGDIAPEVAKKMIGQKIEDTALALADKSPNMAMQVINENAFYIPEERRQILLNKIEQRKTEGGLMLKEDFNTTREKLVIAAERNGAAPKIPLQDYEAVYPGEQAQVMKSRDDSKIDAANEVHALLSQTKGMFPEQKKAVIMEAEKKMESEDQLRALATIAAPALNRDAELFKSDHVQWLLENNASIQTLQKDSAMSAENEIGFATDGNLLPQQGEVGTPAANGDLPPPPDDRVAPTKDELVASKTQYYNALLKYQGTPAEGEDSSRYMNLPRSQRHLLTKAQAETYAARINGGDIDSSINTIRSILAEYPSDDLQAQVIQDLTTLPKEKVRPEIQIAFQNADQSWLPQFLGNLRGAKDLEAVNDVDKAALRNSIQANGTWASFHRSVLGPQNQRSAELEGYFNAVEINARAMVAKGMSTKKAAEASVNQLLTSTMKPVAVTQHDPDRPYYWRNDNQLWIPRKPQGYERPLNDVELDDVGRRLGLATADIHPDDVDLAQFPWAAQTVDKDKQRSLIYNKIVSTASYYPEPGGRYYRLTVEGATKGDRIDLRNKNGEFFRVDIAKLPPYTIMDFGMKSIKPKGTDLSKWKSEKYEQAITMPPVPKDGNYPKTGQFWEYAR